MRRHGLMLAMLTALGAGACAEPEQLELREVELKPFEPAAVAEVASMLGCDPCLEFAFHSRDGSVELYLSPSDARVRLGPNEIRRGQLVQMPDASGYGMLLFLSPEGALQLQSFEPGPEVQLVGVARGQRLVAFVPADLLQNPLLIGNFTAREAAGELADALGVAFDPEPLEPAELHRWLERER